VTTFGHREFAGHERVIFVADSATGLRTIIAIHDRTLGLAVGGCRVYPYASEDDALADVRLSRGMTYKNALAGLPFGGGKAVIVADPSAKTPANRPKKAAGLRAKSPTLWPKGSSPLRENSNRPTANRSSANHLFTLGEHKLCSWEHQHLRPKTGPTGDARTAPLCG
jgi:hypothetical protein